MRLEIVEFAPMIWAVGAWLLLVAFAFTLITLIFFVTLALAPNLKKRYLAALACGLVVPSATVLWLWRWEIIEAFYAWLWT